MVCCYFMSLIRCFNGLGFVLVIFLGNSILVLAPVPLLQFFFVCASVVSYVAFFVIVCCYLPFFGVSGRVSFVIVACPRYFHWYVFKYSHNCSFQQQQTVMRAYRFYVVYSIVYHSHLFVMV